jgi:predicted nucleic acid-binding Zn ribbon protein
MERASKLIRAMKLPSGTISPEEVACAVWPGAVGKRIAVHTRAARLVRTRLVIEVEDVIWRRQLMALSPQILHNLEEGLGRGAVEELEFRVVPTRREPQRARASQDLHATAASGDDEANGIADPVLRGIYLASRKRARA